MASQLKTITLKRGKEESLLRFHPWVFSGAIAHLPEGIEEGETVRVEAADGRPLGVGHYEIGSIAVRLLDPTEREIGAEFYAERLAQAWNLRQRLGLIRPDNTTFRLVHGEGDFLPGCVVDIYGDTAVLQAHSPGMHYARNIIANELTRLPDAHIRNVYYKSETTLPFKARLDPVNDYIIGGFDTNIAVENGLKFNIDWLKGQKTGFFVDQRDNRALLQRFSAGARVLNMFCYTGGFSVYAMRGGAELVHS
ncbi:MAG: class I SAM-dependent methyltransferase, partial [Duncaniella sp.]|nr:class I SAM-dependent methyltransferase [Duncaniella sp.]